MDSAAFRTELDTHAIGLGFGVSHDALTVSMQTLSEFGETAFRLLSLSLLEPRFDPSAIAHAKKEMLAEYQLLAQDPRYLLDRAFDEAVFGAHPYGRDIRGSSAGIARITRQDLRQFATRRLGRGNALIAVSGDITARELKRFMDAYLDRLPQGDPIAEITQPTLPVAQVAWETIPFSAPQTIIQFALPGIDRRDPQFFAYFLLHHILGESTLSSRLGEEIRKKQGLAYYINTSPDQYGRTALLKGSSATRNGAARQTMDAIRKELSKLAQNGVTDEEMAEAKDNVIGSFPLKLDSNNAIADFLLVMLLYGLGSDYVDRRETLIHAVTRQEVNTLAKKLLAPGHLLMMSIGQALPSASR